ncbi:MAG: DUF5723 family protein [Bacteroidales bacterium]|nr:DUF5723 family protein [Bacteroidales bacterium]
MIKILYKTILIPTFILFSIFVSAQNDVSIHLLQSVPQSIYTNPSFNPEAKIYVGIPVLSSIYFGISHSGFAYNDIIKRQPDDSLYLDVDNMLSKLKKNNYLSAQYNWEILSFGFKVGKNYFSFNATEKISTRFTYPEDLLKLAWKGNTQFIDEPADFSGTGVNMTHYREYALGYNRQLSDKLNVGLRGKLLYGKANVWTERSGITLRTDPATFDLTASSDIVLNMSLPQVVFDDSLDFDPLGYVRNTENTGLAFDFGASYKINDKFTVAASVLDIGKISWKSNVKNFSSENASFTFEGIDLNDFFNKDSTAKDGFEILMDTLEKTFDFKETSNAYSTWLPGIVYLTGVYNLTRKDKIGLLVRADIFNSKILPSYTLSYNKRFFNFLSAVASYSIMNRSYTNIGFGMSLQLGPFQIYALNDNIYGLFAPTKSKNTNIHFGLNLVFGYRIKPPEAPLIF